MIKAIALDVDGVLTDGTFLWDGAGAELKRFSFRDVMGIARAARRPVSSSPSFRESEIRSWIDTPRR